MKQCPIEQIQKTTLRANDMNCESQGYDGQWDPNPTRSAPGSFCKLANPWPAPIALLKRVQSIHPLSTDSDNTPSSKHTDSFPPPCEQMSHHTNPKTLNSPCESQPHYFA
mmetsp:Transcript_1596/g.5497  ORF Transcript_1596/g.5497 Transcript_1596/m.5497 type:complete len:110 (-) Transcript_1596:397-726(-)